MARLLSLLAVLCVVVPAADAAAQTARLTGVRHLSGVHYTRVIIDLNRPVRYSAHRLPPASGSKLSRIYLDIPGTRLTMRGRRIDVNDRLVRRIRLSQFKTRVVRVVLDLKHRGKPDIALMANPHRIVIDVERDGKGAGRGYRRVRKIVLDPGHGGKDPGAVGVGGLREKDVVLRVARNLAPRLRKQMGVDVVLTRNRDVFVPLEERTAMANREKADLFVSIHSNASANRRAAGLETYYLDKTTDEATMKLAARENGTARRNLTDLQIILSDLKLSAYVPDSITLAKRLQSSVVENVRPRYPQARDLGVKKGLFYVLVGARMPAALAELFFVSNRREARELQRPKMRTAIVEGLSRGIRNYADTPPARRGP